MPTENVKDFRLGLDARRYFLSSPVGSLTSAINCHISQGGELEKRKAFVKLSIPSAYNGIHFGLQEGTSGIYIFGSKTFPRSTTGNRQRTSNVATLFVTTRGSRSLALGDVVNISGIGGSGYNGTGITILSATNTIVSGAQTTQTITYASIGANEGLTVDSGGVIVLQVSTQLPSPLIYEALTNPGSDEPGGYADGLNVQINMASVVSSTAFTGEPFVIASYSDGTTFPFYGNPTNITLLRSGVTQVNAQGALLDSYLGLQLAAFVAVDLFSGENLLKLLAVDINNNVAAYTTNYVAGNDHFDIFSIPTTLNGTPFTTTDIIDSTVGTLAIVEQNTGTPSIAASDAVGSFEIISAGAGTQATGTLTSNVTGATNVTDGDTVTVGATTYRFKNTMALANDVQRGASRAASLTSLAATINGTGVVGTDYFAGSTVPNASTKCNALNVTTNNYSLSLMAINGGTAGNALALSTTAGTLVASAATLAGGVASTVSDIKVNGVSILAAPVAFITDITTTAAAVATEINTTPVSGYSATSNGGTITLQTIATGITANGFTVQIVSVGTIVCSTGAYSLTGSGFTLDYTRVNGVNLLNPASPYIAPNTSPASLIYPLVPNQVLSDFCRVVANSINSGTATHSYLAHCPQGSISIYISKATTISTDPKAVLDVSVTPTGGQSGAAIPVTVTPLTVSLDQTAVAIPVGGNSIAVTVTVQGGVAPFKYVWSQQGANAIGVKANQPKSAQTTFSSATNRTVQEQLQIYVSLPAASKPAYLNAHPALKAYLDSTQVNQVAFVCSVTDALGEQATSDAVFITLLGR